MKAVAANPAENGLSALSDTLQKAASRDYNTVIQPHEQIETTIPAAVHKNSNKRRSSKVSKRKVQAALPVETTVPLQLSPSRPKCQGCIHSDLLEMKQMEPVHIKYYLKSKQFLEWAKCAGTCKQMIKAIHVASPKANIYYCDENNKGFYAPDNDIKKKEMECGLILCSPCRALRAVTYELENTKDGSNNRRPRRRVQTRL